MKITSVIPRQILDSRGNPTVEVDVILEGGFTGRAAVPSGASTGIHEAHELRDGKKAFGGLGVQKAIANINDVLFPGIADIPADDQFALDARMCELDGTPNKSKLGANALLAVSLAVAQAAANKRGLPLYQHLNDIAGKPEMSIPMPMINVLNGGKHADHSTDMQESMIIPIGATSYAQAIQMSAEVFAALKSLLKANGSSTLVGDEGGFTLQVKESNREALELLTEAIIKAGYEPGKDISFGLDVAASEFYENDIYNLSAEHKQLSQPQLIDWYKQLVTDFPVISIEDCLDQDDWEGWQAAQKNLDLQLVGDDLLVTNIERLQKGIDLHAANAILIKPNQIGTLTETIRAIQLAKKHGWNTIVSHRSGETEDVTIAHIAVGTGAGQIKTGSVSRSDRTAKHNELLRIEAADPVLKLFKPF
jgi:enolase